MSGNLDPILRMLVEQMVDERLAKAAARELAEARTAEHNPRPSWANEDQTEGTKSP